MFQELTKHLQKNIVEYREENGIFNSRKDLLKVAKLGPKAFEQCAGFLRIRDGKEPLDNTSVHPESYKAAKALLKLFDYSEKDIALGLKICRKRLQIIRKLQMK